MDQGAVESLATSERSQQPSASEVPKAFSSAFAVDAASLPAGAAALGRFQDARRAVGGRGPCRDIATLSIRAGRGAAAARRGRAARRGVGALFKASNGTRFVGRRVGTSRGGIGNGFGGSGGLLVRHDDWCCCFLSLGLRARVRVDSCAGFSAPVSRRRRGDSDGRPRPSASWFFARAQQFLVSYAADGLLCTR